MLSTSARRIIAGLFLVVVAAAVTWFMVGWLRRPAPGREEGREVSAPMVSLRESVVEHSRGGEPAWRLNIEEIQIGGGGRAVAAAGLREGLVYDQGKPVVRIAAGQATYNTTDKSFQVTGGVKVVSVRGAIVTTTQVRWVPTTQTLHCPEEVTMRAEGVTVRTESLDLIVPQDLVRAPGRTQVRTRDGQLTGRDLTYHLDTGAYTLRNIQAVFTLESAREELGRLR